MSQEPRSLGELIAAYGVPERRPTIRGTKPTTAQWLATADGVTRHGTEATPATAKRAARASCRGARFAEVEVTSAYGVIREEGRRVRTELIWEAVEPGEPYGLDPDLARAVGVEEETGT